MEAHGTVFVGLGIFIGAIGDGVTFSGDRLQFGRAFNLSVEQLNDCRLALHSVRRCKEMIVAVFEKLLL